MAVIRGGWEWKRVLILVKTYPNPSTKYREIVCTAGVDEDGNFLRLYPIQFRSLHSRQYFSKWQFIDVRLRKARGDHRRESYEVEQESITPGDTIGSGSSWPERWAFIEPLIAPSLESVKSIDASERPSLTIIKPQDYEFLISEHKNKEYTPKERRKLIGTLGFDTLFGDRLNQHFVLEKIPWKFQYRWTCCEECKSPHTSFFEDWEIGESYRKWRLDYSDDTTLREKLRYRYADEPRAKNNLYLVLGTHSRFRDTWLVIGHFRPQAFQRSTVSQLTFDLT
jgi:hypothetical protein